jgi:hypothetical protein
VRYMHEGRRFPCLDGCPGVRDLPVLTVGDYLAGQQTAEGESAQDATLELAQDLGEAAFAIIIDTGAVRVAGPAIMRAWREVAGASPSGRAAALPERWRDLLLVPDLAADQPGTAFVASHQAMLQATAQREFADLGELDALIRASSWCLGMGLHLVQACGADPGEVARRWLTTAQAAQRAG